MARGHLSKPLVGAQPIPGHPHHAAGLGRWLLNERSGISAGDSLGFYQPSLIAAPNWSGAGIRFDGFSTQIPISINLSGDFTLIFEQAITNDGMLWSNDPLNRQFRIGQGGANVLSIYDGTNNTISSALSTPKGQFSVVAYVRRGTTVSFFENGGFISSGTITSGAIALNMVGLGLSLGAVGVISGVLASARAWPQEELAGYAAAPYAGFAVPSSKLWSFGATVTASTIFRNRLGSRGRSLLAA